MNDFDKAPRQWPWPTAYLTRKGREMIGDVVEPKRIGPEAPSPDKPDDIMVPEWVRYVGTAAGVACAYHGYRRTGSVWWAIGWSLFGALAFPLAVPIALAQGFGAPKRRANPGRRRRRRR